MPSLSVRHESGDRFRIAVRGHEVLVDQPVRDGGDDAGPTPTELFVGSLASCVAFYASRFLRRHGVAAGELAIESDFTMSAEPPWRVGSVRMQIVLPRGVPDEIAAGALRAAEHCTVQNSILMTPAIAIALTVPEAVA